MIRFEVALVSAHCNCLIGCIAIPQGYRPSNIGNTTADIYLSKTGVKILRQNVKFLQTSFYQPFACPNANLVSLTRRQPHSLDVNDSSISRMNQWSLGAS